MPLSMFRVGESARVVRVGGTSATARHLGSLGFSVGAVVRVIEDTDGGKIVGIRESRLALDNDVARRIECAVVRDSRPLA